MFGESRWFSYCRKLAIKNAGDKKMYNFGALLIKGGSILSTGTNKPRTDPLIGFLAEHSKGIPQQIHAEIDCLSGVQRHLLRSCDLYVARVKLGKGVFALAKPCVMCEDYSREMEIRRVFYSIRSEPDTELLEYGVIKF